MSSHIHPDQIEPSQEWTGELDFCAQIIGNYG